jgi:uncharacterized tellurite resistance protein B-like protein
MEMSHHPDEWSLRQWLAFLLLSAATADGKRDKGELRYLSVELGQESVATMAKLLDALPVSESDRILRESLPIFLKRPGAREKLQRLLRDVFLADGEYGEAEQAMTKKIGDWIRAAGIQ